MLSSGSMRSDPRFYSSDLGQPLLKDKTRQYVCGTQLLAASWMDIKLNDCIKRVVVFLLGVWTQLLNKFPYRKILHI